MSTTCTEHDMSWMSQCCIGAPTPKELANESLFYQEEGDEEFAKEITKEYF